jgi:hypothetical protein
LIQISSTAPPCIVRLIPSDGPLWNGWLPSRDLLIGSIAVGGFLLMTAIFGIGQDFKSSVSYLFTGCVGACSRGFLVLYLVLLLVLLGGTLT